ncbi:unnamed protein product [Wuchereria bancrofti]|uniref:Uncharacterized protein n=1 Tax=Wuchereria bancrofti TaxID=6293 RepID=A0A3P7EU80_WUCBA|nr:unnamed protein product [Wuchereria bancrofti]
MLDTLIPLLTSPITTSKVNLRHSLSPLTFFHIIFNITVNKYLVLKLLMRSLCETQSFEFDDATNYSKLKISKSNFGLNSRGALFSQFYLIKFHFGCYGNDTAISLV